MALKQSRCLDELFCLYVVLASAEVSGPDQAPFLNLPQLVLQHKRMRNPAYFQFSKGPQTKTS